MCDFLVNLGNFFAVIYMSFREDLWFPLDMFPRYMPSYKLCVLTLADMLFLRGPLLPCPKPALGKKQPA